MTAFGKDDFMYPMSLLCHRRLPPLVIARMGCQGLRASRRSEKYTMRMVVQIFCSRVCTCPAKDVTGPGVLFASRTAVLAHFVALDIPQHLALERRCPLFLCRAS